MKDLDTDKRLCDACLKATGTAKITAAPGTETTYLSTRSTNLKCCGNDKGEGGWPYGATAKSTSGNANKGKYFATETVCDDYVDTNGNSEFDDGETEINNDCKEGANCGDTSCAVSTTARTVGWSDFLGPRGSVCCKASTASASKAKCKQFLDPDASNSDGVECGGNNECDCVPVGIGTVAVPRIHATLTRPTTIITCVPPSNPDILDITGDFYDRMFAVTDAEGKTFTVTSQATTGDEAKCGAGQITLYFNLVDTLVVGTDHSITGTGSADSFYFANWGDFDCLVTVTIT
jgi:hypothetical protein